MPEIEKFYNDPENASIIAAARKEWNSPCKMCGMFPCDCPENEERYLDK